MPKVIIQPVVSIDSLHTKLALLEYKFSKLNTEHKLILDSLNSLKASVDKSEISTSFYSTHLGSYTTIFGAIMTILCTLIVAFNLFSIYFPLQKQLRELKRTTIPKIRRDNENSIDIVQQISNNFMKQSKDLFDEFTSVTLLHHLNFKRLDNDSNQIFFAILRLVTFQAYDRQKLTESDINEYIRYGAEINEMFNNNSIQLNAFNDDDAKLIVDCLNKICCIDNQLIKDNYMSLSGRWVNLRRP